MSDGLAIEELDAAAYDAAIPELGALIVDAVAGGAGVNFLAGVTADEAAGWWADRRPLVADGTMTAYVARDPARDGGIVGSVIIVRSRNQNSPHRAEIGKVLVLRSHRRRGIARALMVTAEARARADGRWMLILDTVADSPADALYRSLGWNRMGTMPFHAMLPDGTPSTSAFFWKDLRS